MKISIKSIKNISYVLLTVLLLSSCSSSTVIHTIPEGAKTYIDGEFVGETPCYYEDTKISFVTTNSVRLEKEGYKTYHTSFTRDEVAEAGPIIAGCFLLVPWLWSFGYKNSHSYQLEKLDGSEEWLNDDVKDKDSGSGTGGGNDPPPPPPPASGKSKADQLRDLKQLKDEGILTDEEFEIEKKKVLDSE